MLSSLSPHSENLQTTVSYKGCTTIKFVSNAASEIRENFTVTNGGGSLKGIRRL